MRILIEHIVELGLLCRHQHTHSLVIVDQHKVRPCHVELIGHPVPYILEALAVAKWDVVALLGGCYNNIYTIHIYEKNIRILITSFFGCYVGCIFK